MSDHIPESVKFGLAVLQVRRIPLEEVEAIVEEDRTVKERLGHYENKFQRIMVARGAPALPSWQWFFHELGHHAEDAAGQDFEDCTLNWFGAVVVQILVDNPGLQQRVLADLGGSD